jgi:hypothetical protein
MRIRRRVVRPAAVAWLTAGLALAGTPAAGATPAAGQVTARGWTLRLATQYEPATNHSQYLAVVAGRTDAWFFGGSNITGHGVPEVAHWIAGRFRFPLLPAGLHSWIVGASAISPASIWAVTYLGGAVLHWNGTAWATEPRGGWPAGTQFTGISALSASNVWLFGAGSASHPGAGTWHWNGIVWTQATGPGAGIRQASVASRSDAWGIGGVGGSRNALFKLGGSSWRRVSPAALAGFRYTDVLALAPANIWVAGSVAGVPKLAHFAGSGWTLLAMPGSVAATGICRNGTGGLWVIAQPAAGPSFVRERSAGGHWSKVTVSSSSANEIVACALVPGGQSAWGAGKAAAPRGTAAAAYGHGSLP